MATDQTVQTAVWHLELGRGKIVLQWIVVVLAAIGLGLWYTANQFRGLEKREAMDAAQLARNISRGEGFRTSVVRPVALWHLQTYRDDHDASFESQPDTYNAPLYPLALAAVFRLMPPTIFEGKISDIIYPPERWVIVPFNQICLLASVLLIFYWARQAFDRRVAVTASLLLLSSDTLWSYGISGLSTTFLMLLLLGAAFCLYTADRRLNPPEPAAPARLDGTTIALVVGSAVLLGLCCLTRYTALFFVVPMALYTLRIFRGRRAGLWAGMYAVVALAVLVPWLIRNFEVSHSLLGTAQYQIFSTENFERQYKVVLKDAWSLRGVTARVLTDVRRFWIEDFRLIGSDFLVFFFVVGVMYGFRRHDVARLRYVLIGALLTAIVGMAVIGLPHEPVTPSVNGGNLLVLLLPLVAVFGCAFFYLLLDRIPFRMKLTRGLAVGTFVLLNVAPIILTLLPPQRSRFPYPPYCQPYMQAVAKWYDKSDVGVSDAPWAVAWYMDRTTLWLPATPEEYHDIHDFVAPHSTQFIFLTPYMLNRPYESDLVNGEFKPWAMLFRGKMPDKFPMRSVTVIPPGTDQLLFSDRPRWTEAAETNLIEQAIRKSSK